MALEYSLFTDRSSEVDTMKLNSIRIERHTNDPTVLAMAFLMISHVLLTDFLASFEAVFGGFLASYSMS